MHYSIQLYSVRDQLQRDMEGTLAQLAAMGYRLVEPAGFGGRTPEDMRAILDRCGLAVSGTHTGWQQLAEDYEGTVRAHRILGTDQLIIPGFDCSTQARLDQFIDFVNDIQPRLAADGIRLGYHNHSREFIMTDYGQCVWQALTERTKVDFEVDIYWAFNAGVDPIRLVERLKDRIHFLHIKDGKKGTGEGTPLGLGQAPVAQVYRQALDLGLQLVVESETQIPDGLTEAKICIDYLKTLEG